MLSYINIQFAYAVTVTVRHTILIYMKKSHIHKPDKDTETYRFKFIFIPTFNIFGSVWILCFDYFIEKCKITMILIGSMLPNLKGHWRGFINGGCMAHPLSF